MKSIHEISQYSSFVPKSGEMAELFEMAELGLDRTEAMDSFLSSGRSADHFRQVFKSLKDELLKKAFAESIPQLSALKQRRMVCWQKFSQVKQLLILEEGQAARNLAVEVLNLAERFGFVEIENSLLSELEYYYGAINPDTRRYLRYRRRLVNVRETLLNQQEASSLIAALVYQYKRKKNWQSLWPQIKKIAESKNQHPAFNRTRFNLLVIWYQMKQDYHQIAETCKTALKFFDNQPKEIALVFKRAYYTHLIPLLTAKGDYVGADRYLIHSLSMTKAGTQNWHLVLLQKAYLGFYSGKPLIAFDAWKRAMNNLKHDDPEVDERWHTVHAYLAIFEKLGQIKLDKPFRLGKYMSSITQLEQEKVGSNVAVLVVQLLHLLMDGKRIDYMEKVEGIPTYVQSHLRGKENLRSRCILHMLAKVETADYHRLRAQMRTDRWTRQLKKNPAPTVTENEIMPYEKVWEIVLGRLK